MWGIWWCPALSWPAFRRSTRLNILKYQSPQPTETEGSAPVILGLPPDPPHEPIRALVVSGPDVWLSVIYRFSCFPRRVTKTEKDDVTETPRSDQPSKGSSLARAFTRLGWVGFWLQVVFGSLPIIVMAYYLTFSRSASVSRSGFPFVEDLDDRQPADARFYHLLVVPLYKACQANHRSGTASIGILRDWVGVDRSGGEHGRYAILHDCDTH